MNNDIRTMNEAFCRQPIDIEAMKQTQRNRKLLEVIARKQDQELEGKSIEELEKMLDEE